MPIHSKRGETLGHSPIRVLMPFARKAKAEGKHVFHLNIGQPDIETPPQALEAIRNNNETIIPYGPSEGLPSLRTRVAHYYSTLGISIQSDDVFVTTGASEAILFTFFSCCDEFDEVIIPEPFYANYIGFGHTSSIKIVPIPSTLETEFALPTVDKFEELITPKTKAILLCNPGNPTGCLYTKEELSQLMALVKKYDLFIIVDEVYREFCYDIEFTSVLTFDEMSEHIIVIDSISKVFSSCGARIGFLITKNKAIQKVVEKYAQLRLCPPYYGQKLAEVCYDHAHDYIPKAKAEYFKRREVLYNGLKSIEGVNCYKPKAAFYNMTELPVHDASHFCQWMLESFSYENKTVMLAPGSGFYFHRAYGLNQVRIAYILNETDLAEALNCLSEGLRHYKKIGF
ncbi:MAG TPA: pyridoxal phosphate-dependent aminotransferase [Saprospiraceae bacterium]|nr:pyridoxal phosphate-dependent aminotransferase [Saprospiraceae bacterium]